MKGMFLLELLEPHTTKVWFYAQWHWLLSVPRTRRSGLPLYPGQLETVAVHRIDIAVLLHSLFLPSSTLAAFLAFPISACTERRFISSRVQQSRISFLSQSNR
jgi:hypothetical protein